MDRGVAMVAVHIFDKMFAMFSLFTLILFVSFYHDFIKALSRVVDRVLVVRNFKRYLIYLKMEYAPGEPTLNKYSHSFWNLYYSRKRKSLSNIVVEL